MELNITCLVRTGRASIFILIPGLMGRFQINHFLSLRPDQIHMVNILTAF